MVDRLISAEQMPGEEPQDLSLRPRRLSDYVNQVQVKANLEIAIQAALRREEPLDHLLLYGPPGLGKTTLAQIVAHEMDVNIRITSGPALEGPGQLASMLSAIGRDRVGVFFIDEIHRLHPAIEEVLYSAMEDFALDIVLGKGMAAHGMRITLPRFTLIGATTRYAMVSAPLRDRFGSVYRLDFHDVPALTEIVLRSARILDSRIDEEGALEIARRSRGTPRIANRLLRRARDYAEVKADGVISRDVANEALSRLEIDHLGLDQLDHRVLQAIIEKFNGGPVGLETIAASISEDADTIMDVYEPYLLQLGFLNRTPRGRIATRRAYEHLQIPYPEPQSANQASFWDSAQA
jgi:holliday junction DNA helicase RuvB